MLVQYWLNPGTGMHFLEQNFKCGNRPTARKTDLRNDLR